MATAAEKLGVTTSQLVKFLKFDPAVWQFVSHERSQRGLKAYY